MSLIVHMNIPVMHIVSSFLHFFCRSFLFYCSCIYDILYGFSNKDIVSCILYPRYGIVATSLCLSRTLFFKMTFNESNDSKGPEINMCLVVRKPAFRICENKDADQLRGNREADQRLCFRYTDSTIPLLPTFKFQASSHLLWLYRPVCIGPGRKPRRPVFSERGSYASDVNVRRGILRS